MNPALASVSQFVEHHPTNQKVISLIPSQGTHLCCRCVPGGACGRQPVDVSPLTSMCLSLSFSLPSLLSKIKNKIFKKLKEFLSVKERHTNFSLDSVNILPQAFWRWGATVHTRKHTGLEQVCMAGRHRTWGVAWVHSAMRTGCEKTTSLANVVFIWTTWSISTGFPVLFFRQLFCLFS